MAPRDIIWNAYPRVLLDYDQWLKKMELDFDLNQWFEFLGVRIDPLIVQAENLIAAHLQRLETLTDIVLRFPDPYEWQHCCDTEGPVTHAYYAQNPWGRYILIHADDEDFIANGGPDMKSFPCNRMAVDWIMQFLFPTSSTFRMCGLRDSSRRRSRESGAPSWTMSMC